MLLRQFCLGSNLPMQIREKTDFPRRKQSAKVNFEGSTVRRVGIAQ